jgi:hypothetical protein
MGGDDGVSGVTRQHTSWEVAGPAVQLDWSNSFHYDLVQINRRNEKARDWTAPPDFSARHRHERQGHDGRYARGGRACPGARKTRLFRKRSIPAYVRSRRAGRRRIINANDALAHL